MKRYVAVLMMVRANFNGLRSPEMRSWCLDLAGSVAAAEPSSPMLLCVGIAGFALRRRAAR
jgi:hypothetical protein